VAQCAQGSAFGFDGKTLIHPGQIDPCNQAFTPDSAAVEAARRIVAAFAAPQNANQGALRVDGQMVERLHLAQARRTLAMAGTDDEAAVQEAPYGSWASPLTAARATAGALRLGQITVDGDDVYCLPRELQCPQSGARIRRRGLRRASGHDLRLELR
jgi:hypothetical protein